ncbi:MAG TPA: hypothetical protein VIC28_02360, partial [Thermoanaerobaculia bacterium]
GPGFLTTEFIMEKEVPMVLEAPEEQRLRFFPLVVSSCRYEESILGPYQTFNSPDQPLLDLSRSGQDRILNALVDEIEKVLRERDALKASS